MSGGFVIPGLGEAKPNEALPISSFAPQAVENTGAQIEQPSTNQAGNDKPAAKEAMGVDSFQPPALTQPLEPTEATRTNTSVVKPINEDLMDVDENAQDTDPMQASAVTRDAQNPESRPVMDASFAQENTTQTTAHAQAGQGDDKLEESAHVTDALDAALLAMSQSKPEDLGPTTETIMQAQAPITHTAPVAQEGASAEWEADSSPYESSSDSSSSDDSSDDDSESGAMGLEETVRMLMANGDDSDADSDAGGDGKNGGKGRQVRSKNEQPDWVPPKPEVTITEEMEILPLGSIMRIVGNTVLIQSGDNGEERVLDIETAVCRADRSIIAAIADVIGTVLNPMYILRFATSEEVAKEGLTTDMPVFFSPQHAQVVLTRALRQQKGYDASNLHDEEIPMEDQEFSDDEQEQAHKRQQKMRKKNNRGGRGGRGGAQNREMGSGHHGPSTGAVANADVGLNYDDDDDGPYKPLSRPVNFGMGAPPSFGEGATFNGDTISRGHGNDRGGERDNFRDRGRGRGRGNRGGFRGGRGGSSGGYSNGYSKPQQDRFPNKDQHQQVPHPQPQPQPQSAASYQWMPPPPPMPFTAGPQHAQQGGAAMPFAFPPFPPPAHQFGGNPPPAPPMGHHPPPAVPPTAGQSQANWQAMAALYANPAFQQALRQAQQQQPQQGQPGWGQSPGAPQ